jgi:hypothetical protein
MPIYRATSAQITAWLATAAALRTALAGGQPGDIPAFGLVNPAPATGQPAAYTAGLVDSLINAGAQTLTLPSGAFPNPNNWLLQVPPQISGLRIPITLSLEFAANLNPPAEAIAAGLLGLRDACAAVPEQQFLA